MYLSSISSRTFSVCLGNAFHILSFRVLHTYRQTHTHTATYSHLDYIFLKTNYFIIYKRRTRCVCGFVVDVRLSFAFPLISSADFRFNDPTRKTRLCPGVIARTIQNRTDYGRRLTKIEPNAACHIRFSIQYRITSASC